MMKCPRFQVESLLSDFGPLAKTLAFQQLTLQSTTALQTLLGSSR